MTRERYEHVPSAAELKLMADQYGFRFNTVSAYQRDLANDWAIIIGSYRTYKRVRWVAKLDHKSRIKKWAKGFESAQEAAEAALVIWRPWLAETAKTKAGEKDATSA